MKNLIIGTIMFASFGAHAQTFDAEAWEPTRARLSQIFTDYFASATPDPDPALRELWALNQRLVWRHENEQRQIGDYVVRGAVRLALEHLGPLDIERTRHLTTLFLDFEERFSLEPGRDLPRVAAPMNAAETRRRRRIYGGLGAAGAVLAGTFEVMHYPVGTIITFVPTLMMGMKMLDLYQPSIQDLVSPHLRDCGSLFLNQSLRAGGETAIIEQGEPT